MLSLLPVCSLILCFVRKAYSVPPDACFAKFRWEDCGKPPTPVMYYWKSGSRCEVGMWRGCLPNYNMFKDEYECVATCIFAARARPSDFHNYNEVLPDMTEAETEITLSGNETTDGNTTDSSSNSTDVTGGGGDETGATVETGDTGATGGETGGGDSTGEPATEPAEEGGETTVPAEEPAAE